MKDFTLYQEALELRDLGFDEPCFGWFTGSYLRIGSVVENKHVQGEDEISAPLYQQAFRWFREKYNLDNWVYCSDENKGYFAIIVSHRKLVIYNEIKNTYEEAELACLIKLIEIVKKK